MNLRSILARHMRESVFVSRDLGRRLLKYCLPFRRQWLLCLFLSISLSASSGAVLWLVERSSSVMVNIRDLSEIRPILVLATLIFTWIGLIAAAQSYLSSWIGQRIATNLRQDCFDHVLLLSKSFHDRQAIGDLMARFNQDIQTIQYGISRAAPRVLRALFVPLAVVSYLLFLNWRLTLLTVFIIPMFGVLVSTIGKKMRLKGHRTAQEMAVLDSRLQETLTNLYVVKCFAAESHESKRFQEQNERAFHAFMKENLIVAMQKPATALLQAFGFLLVIGYSGSLRIETQISLEGITAFLFGLGLLIEACSAFSNVHLEFQRTIVSIERVFQLLAQPITIEQAAKPFVLNPMRGTVRFCAVDFRYQNKGAYALKGIDFSVPAGQKVALVGLSGSGKSTLINLILRLYDPVHGKIFIDDCDLRALDLDSLRAQIGVVAQEFGLFSGSIRDNIAYGKPNASDREIIRAAQFAHAHEFVERLPDRYAAQIGERAVHLSAGEKQRIAIARVFLRDPRIIILDEATAFLDARSEELIQQSLQHLLNGRTAFIIAHRLSTVRCVDRILVFRQGSLVESGTHTQLLSQCGLYKELFDMQFKKQ